MVPEARRACQPRYSPDEWDAVWPQPLVRRHDRGTLNRRPGDKDAVERVPVVPRQALDLRRVIDGRCPRRCGSEGFRSVADGMLPAS